MEVKVINLENQEVGSISLNENIFGVEFLRPDLVKAVVDWQLAKARSGTRKTKNISEVSGTTKKPFKQKGTGNARQGSLRSVHMRGGAVAHGPRVRSHATDLPKKVRKLGLCHALSSKIEQGKLIIVDNVNLANHKTSNFNKALNNFGFDSYFFVYTEESHNFVLASRNLYNVKSVPQIGINVYDIIKHDCVFMTVDAVKAIEVRLSDV
jgi:large subunit ribosomal protein L4